MVGILSEAAVVEIAAFRAPVWMDGISFLRGPFARSLPYCTEDLHSSPSIMAERSYPLLEMIRSLMRPSAWRTSLYRRRCCSNSLLC